MSASSMTPHSEERQLGVKLFNATWDLMDKRDRTPAEDLQMIHMAHASAHHWLQAPECIPQNRAISEWQCARVYTILGLGESAVFHARRSLQICEENPVADWVLASAHVALASAAALTGHRELFELHYNMAIESTAKIADNDEREHIAEDLHRGPWFGMTNGETSA